MQEMITLGFLFDPQDLFAKTRSPGSSDGIDLGLGVSPDLEDPKVWSGILNLCARLCFEVLSFDAPLIVHKDQARGKKACLEIDLLTEPQGLCTVNPGFVSIEKTEERQVCIQSVSAPALGMILNRLAMGPLEWPDTPPIVFRPKDRLTGIFQPQGILSDCRFNGRALEDICLKPKPGRMEADTPGNWPRFHPLDFAGLYKEDPVLPFRRRLNAIWFIQSPTLSFHTGLALCDALCAMVMEATAITLPLVFGDKDELLSGNSGGSAPLCFEVEEAAPGADGLVVQFSSPSGPVKIRGSKGFSDFLFPWVDLALNQGGPGFSRALTVRDQVAGFSQPAPAREAIAPLPKEILPIVHNFVPGSEVQDILSAVSGIKPGHGPLVCEAWVSKPSAVRAQLHEQIETLLSSKGYRPGVRVLNAFKPGLCRILEVDLPILLEKKPARVQILYRPFDGVKNALELSHRWLHELFPVAEILADRLSISTDAVDLSMENNQEETYRLTAFDEKGRILVQERFSPFFQTFDYRAFCPDHGSVSPTCAGITIRQGEKELIHKAIPTDRDRFWKQFQTVFVPDLIASMETRIQTGGFDRLPAFFESIRVEVFLDESNYRLGFMDEQISPMEKLHEDIYFFLLKVFEQFSIEHGLPESLKLGQILPRVHSSAGRQGARANIRALPARQIFVPGLETSAVAFDTLSMDRDGWALSNSLDEKTSSLSLHLISAPSELTGGETLLGPVPPDLLLTTKSVGQYLSRFNKLAHIQVWEIARSLQKRPIYAVEAFRVQGGRISVPRLRIQRPTVLFNARHHANEISSTNATLQFIEFLGGSQGQACLDIGNAVFLPMENVDGVATFEELYEKDCSDILHAARYNALGSEFYNQYFKHPPAFSEALAKQRLWQRWLPELMADLHGVPGHEWCQPYAGYLPAGFREFWIPRAFVYVHLPFLEDPGHPLYGQAMALAEHLRKAVAGSRKMVAANEQITALYNRYARTPEPEIFPEADSTELTALPLLGRARNFNFAVQYPNITRAEVIVEVPDEVAHGDNLGLCVAAHYNIQKALMEALTPRKSNLIALLDQKSGHRRFELSISQAQGPGTDTK